MVVLDDAFLYALMAAEFQEIPTVRPDSGLAHMREKTVCCHVCSADTDSAVRCEHSSVAVQTLDSAVRCEHSLVAVQTLTVPSDVNTPQSQPSAQHVVTNQAEVSKAAKV